MGLVNSKEAKMTSQKIEQSNSSSSHILKKWAIPGLFFFIFVFSIHS